MTLREVLRKKIDLEKRYAKSKKLSTKVEISKEISKLNKLIDKKFRIY